jgi:hypothetical protein
VFIPSPSIPRIMSKMWFSFTSSFRWVGSKPRICVYRTLNQGQQLTADSRVSRRASFTSFTLCPPSLRPLTRSTQSAPRAQYNNNRIHCTTFYDFNRARSWHPNWEKLEDWIRVPLPLALVLPSQSHSTHSEIERSGVIPSLTIDFHCKLVS